MVSCGGQATIPMVAAVSRVQPVEYAEIVATVASRSVGPGTRQNIDEFTRTTAGAVEKVGGAKRGKAIIVINPAEPPLIMRDTIHCLTETEPDQAAITASSARHGARGADATCPATPLKNGPVFDGKRVSVFMEVEGLGDYLPEVRGQPRHHDGGGAAHRRAVRRGDVSGAFPRPRGPHEPVAAAEVTLHDMSPARRHAPEAPPDLARADDRRRRPALDAAGVPLIEVTHGDGLGGASINYGFPAHTRRGVPARGGPAHEARARSPRCCLPGIGTVDHLQLAVDCGVGTIRVATHCTEADVSGAAHRAARASSASTRSAS